MSFIYLFSFASLYIQLPGLFSRTGILPVHKLPVNNVEKPEDFLSSPNLLRLAHLFSLDNYDFLEIITVAGALISFLACAFESFRTVAVFAILWLCHFACYSAGQVFLHFQWDILLLEAGFLAILLGQADLISKFTSKHVPSDRIVIFMFKWLLFRLMFASGVVKLTSDCPAWWSLKALHHHFETQCIPTPFAYFAHQLPEWILKLATVTTLYLEIIAPLMFLLPLKGLRLFSFYSQVFLQLCIIFTGNYNFFNLLTICLCYSLLVDADFSQKCPAPAPVPAQQKGKKGKNASQTAVAPCKSSCLVATILSHLTSVVLILASLAATVYLFKLSVHGNTVNSEMGFSKAQFKAFLVPTVTYSVYFAIASFVYVLYASLKDAVLAQGAMKKIYYFFGVLVIALISTCVFFASIDVFTHGVAPEVSKTQPTAFARIHKGLMPYQVTSSYGLFRKMTTKRNEVIIEYSDTEKGPWTKLEFVHKPGDVSRAPPFITPHQPRLDWQMWFAALSKPDQNAWIYSLMNGILEGRKEVLELLRVDNIETFKKPKFVRANLHEYKFSPIAAGKTFSVPEKWWVAAAAQPYIPALSTSSEVLKNKLTELGIIGKKNPPPSKNNQVIVVLAEIRKRLGQPRNLHPLLAVMIVLLLTKLRRS